MRDPNFEMEPDLRHLFEIRDSDEFLRYATWSQEHSFEEAEEVGSRIGSLFKFYWYRAEVTASMVTVSIQGSHKGSPFLC